MSDFIHVPRGGRGGRPHRGGGGQWNRNRGADGPGRGRGGRGRGRGRGGRFHNCGRGGGGGGMPRDYDIANDPIEILGKYSASTLNIAVEGCCHGELDPIYDRLLAHEKQTGQKVDLLICCGDFQSFRNPNDFHSCSMPPKYRRLGSFPRYYSGEKEAPILTLFIGGNHEASQPLRELYYGGWAAPKIYYLGAVGVVRFGGLRIGGISGIYKSHDYHTGHHESAPFDNSSLRSVYHVRNVDIYRMKCLSKSTPRVDIIASHDWPVGIEQYGNTQELIRQKPFFREEIEQNNLGSPPNREVLDTVKPAYWFSAHLHVKFFAKVDHQRKEASIDESSGGESAPVHLIPSQVRTMASASPLEKSSNERAEELVSVAAVEEGGSLSEAKKPSTPTTPNNDNQQQTTFHGLESTCVAVNDLTEQMTRFLALDKCLPRRKYLSILHIESPGSSRDGATLEFDPEWLAVLRKTHHLNTTQRRKVNLPDDVVEISKEEIEWVEERLKEKNSRIGETGGSTYRAISTDFQPTVPFYSDPMFQSRNMCPPFPAMGNPQTDFLLDVLELDHSLTHPYDRSLTPQRISESLRCLNEPQNRPMVVDENEIDLEGDDEKEIEDENEIEIDDDNDQVDDTTPAIPSKPSQPDTAITKKPRIDG